MRLRNVKNAKEIIDSNELVITENIFKDNKPLHIEIGCGKGNFIIGKARQNPNINFIGIEKYESILIRALNKVENIPSNLRFMCVDAKNLGNYFKHNVETIYLNFSDPWPKKRHTKRRLTSSVFLNKYDSLFKNEKRIEMKTDNDDLYEFSIESLIENGYDVIKTDTNYLDTIRTEYEDKFISLGKNINYISVVKK